MLCAGLSVFAVVWVLHPIAAERYRSIFLAVVLLLTFLVFRAGGNRPGTHAQENPTPLDWLLGPGRRSSPSATPRSTPTSCSAAPRRPSRSTSSSACSPAR